MSGTLATGFGPIGILLEVHEQRYRRDEGPGQVVDDDVDHAAVEPRDDLP